MFSSSGNNLNRFDERFDEPNMLVGHVDMSRLRGGRVGCVLLSTYVDWYVQQRYYHDHQFAHNLLTLDPQPRK